MHWDRKLKVLSIAELQVSDLFGSLRTFSQLMLLIT